MNTNIAKLSALIALFFAGSASAGYSVTVKNNSKHRVKAIVQWASAGSNRQSAEIEPYQEAGMSGGTWLTQVNLVEVYDLGVYKEYDPKTGKASDFEANPEEPRFGRWNAGLAGMADQIAVIEESKSGALQLEF
jgi:hypothetical protein